MTKWEKFFKDREEDRTTFTIDELYQAFKARLLDELEERELEQLEGAEKAFKDNV